MFYMVHITTDPEQNTFENPALVSLFVMKRTCCVTTKAFCRSPGVTVLYFSEISQIYRASYNVINSFSLIKLVVLDPGKASVATLIVNLP